LTIEKKSFVVKLRMVPSAMTAIRTPPALDWRMLSRFKDVANARFVESLATVESIMITASSVSRLLCQIQKSVFVETSCE
jgi:hypothetical protein